MNPISPARDLWLAWLLRRAAAELRRHGALGIPYTEFATCLDFAEFLEAASRRFRLGDSTDGERLWHLFAPTCDWDDAGGSINTGNLIYAAVGHRFRPPHPASTKSDKRANHDFPPQ